MWTAGGVGGVLRWEARQGRATPKLPCDLRPTFLAKATKFSASPERRPGWPNTHPQRGELLPRAQDPTMTFLTART